MGLIDSFILLFKVLFKMFTPLFIAFLVMIFFQFIIYKTTGKSLYNEYVKFMMKQIKN